MLYVTAVTNLGSLFDVKQIEWTVPEQEMCQRQGSVGSTHSHMIKAHVTIFISTILHAVRQNLVFLDAHSEPFLPNRTFIRTFRQGRDGDVKSTCCLDEALFNCATSIVHNQQQELLP